MEALRFFTGEGDDARVVLLDISERAAPLDERPKKELAESEQRKCSKIWLLLTFSCAEDYRGKGSTMGRKGRE
jgi:hypothetical protein